MRKKIIKKLLQSGYINIISLLLIIKKRKVENESASKRIPNEKM